MHFIEVIVFMYILYRVFLQLPDDKGNCNVSALHGWLAALVCSIWAISKG